MLICNKLTNYLTNSGYGLRDDLILIFGNKLDRVQVLLLGPRLLHDRPESFNRVEGAGLRWKEFLLECLVEEVGDAFGLVRGQIVHDHNALVGRFRLEAENEPVKGGGVVGALEHFVVY